MDLLNVCWHELTALRVPTLGLTRRYWPHRVNLNHLGMDPSSALGVAAAAVQFLTVQCGGHQAMQGNTWEWRDYRHK